MWVPPVRRLAPGDGAPWQRAPGQLLQAGPQGIAHALDRQPVHTGGGQPAPSPPQGSTSSGHMPSTGQCRPGRSLTRQGPPGGLWVSGAELVDWWPGAPAQRVQSTAGLPVRRARRSRWQRLGPGRWLRLPMKEGWLAVVPAGDRIEGILLVGARRPTSGSTCWRVCSARRSGGGPEPDPEPGPRPGESRSAACGSPGGAHRRCHHPAGERAGGAAGPWLGGSNCGTRLPGNRQAVDQTCFLASAWCGTVTQGAE